MHRQAYDWVASQPVDRTGTVLEIGGRNINGTVRDLFPEADYTTLDIMPGDGVDIVADAATWKPSERFDVVVCTEVFEHTAVWPQIIQTAYAALRSGGMFVATMAGPGRAPHSGFDGGALQPGEYYGNVEPADLERELKAAGFADIVIDVLPDVGDLRCVAVR